MIEYCRLKIEDLWESLRSVLLNLISEIDSIH